MCNLSGILKKNKKHVRIVFCALGMIFYYSSLHIAVAQVRLDQQVLTEKNVPEASSMMVDYIKGIVEKKYTNQKLKIYSAIGVRLAQCSIYYGAWSKHTNNSSETQQLSVASKISSEAAIALYPATLPTEKFKSDIEDGKSELDKIARDEPLRFSFLRNCKDFSEPETAENAIRKLLLK